MSPDGAGKTKAIGCRNRRSCSFRRPAHTAFAFKRAKTACSSIRSSLSPSNFLTDAPGQLTNDATIVPASNAGATSAATSNASSASSTSSTATAFNGTAVAIPGTVRASDFDNGGEGVSYHDTTAGNAGGAYRSTDVDLQASSDGGYNVGWTAPGEWLNYSVNVASAGSVHRTGSRGIADGRLDASRVQHGEQRLGDHRRAAHRRMAIMDDGQRAGDTRRRSAADHGALRHVRRQFHGRHRRVVGDEQPDSAPPAQSPTPPPAQTPTTPVGSGGHAVTVPAGWRSPARDRRGAAGRHAAVDARARPTAAALVLPAKSGSDWITIRSAAPDAALPGDGVRITPQFASQLPKVQGGTAGMPAFVTGARSAPLSAAVPRSWSAPMSRTTSSSSATATHRRIR